MSKPFSISLFFPMYNEVDSVEGMIQKALVVLQKVTNDFEIIIVNDGSTDGSEILADRLAAANPHVHVIHHQGNKGYGQALRTGFASASKDIVMYTDCDEPADLWLIRDALPHFANHDMVIGYRLNRWEGIRRFIYSLGYNAMVRLLFGVHVRDINFSFKLIRRDALKHITLSAESVFIDGELLAEATRLGLRIYQIPVEYRARKYGVSHFNSIRAATHTLEEIWTYWRLRRWAKSVRSDQPTIEI